MHKQPAVTPAAFLPLRDPAMGFFGEAPVAAPPAPPGPFLELLQLVSGEGAGAQKDPESAELEDLTTEEDPWLGGVDAATFSQPGLAVKPGLSLCFALSRAACSGGVEPGESDAAERLQGFHPSAGFAPPASAGDAAALPLEPAPGGQSMPADPVAATLTLRVAEQPHQPAVTGAVTRDTAPLTDQKKTLKAPGVAADGRVTMNESPAVPEKAAPVKSTESTGDRHGESDMTERNGDPVFAGEAAGSGSWSSAAEMAAAPLVETAQVPSGRATSTERPTVAASQDMRVETVDGGAEAPVKAKAERIELQVDSPDRGRVQIELVERRGAVHIALRTGAEDTAARIRESLPELAGRLEGEGLPAEAPTAHRSSGMEMGPGEQSWQQDLSWAGGGRQGSREQDAQQPAEGSEDHGFPELLWNEEQGGGNDRQWS
jgi:hypothetical protein